MQVSPGLGRRGSPSEHAAHGQLTAAPLRGPDQAEAERRRLRLNPGLLFTVTSHWLAPLEEKSLLYLTQGGGVDRSAICGLKWAKTFPFTYLSAFYLMFLCL